MKWSRGEVTWSDALTSKTQSGVVSGSFGVVKGSSAWNVIHLPTEKRLFMFKTQRDGKAFVERLVSMSPGGEQYWRFSGKPPAGAAKIFQDALRHARGKPDGFNARTGRKLAETQDVRPHGFVDAAYRDGEALAEARGWTVRHDDES